MGYADKSEAVNDQSERNSLTLEFNYAQPENNKTGQEFWRTHTFQMRSAFFSYFFDL
jgi:hypothetical protein